MEKTQKQQIHCGAIKNYEFCWNEKHEFIHVWNWNPFNVFELNLDIGIQFN
jgi:hypothetical protein